MNITKLIRRALKREGGKEEVNEPQARDFINALDEQLTADSGGDFDLYGILRSLTEVPETTEPEEKGQ